MNNTLWDGRDLTNSSCERVIFPEASILADHILNVMISVLEGIRLNPENIRRNLEMLHGVNMAESVMMELTKRGMDRQDAHEIVRVSSMNAFEMKTPVSEILSQNKEVSLYLKKEEIESLLLPDNYIGTAEWQVDNLVKKLLPLAI
jgi:adenylosuccinate lyase